VNIPPQTYRPRQSIEARFVYDYEDLLPPDENFPDGGDVWQWVTGLNDIGSVELRDGTAARIFFPGGYTTVRPGEYLVLNGVHFEAVAKDVFEAGFRVDHDFPLDRWQDEAMDWSANHAKITHNLRDKLIKLNEEAGEVGGADIKLREGRVTEEAFWKEVGDTMFVLCTVAGLKGKYLSEVIPWHFPTVTVRRPEQPTPPVNVITEARIMGVSIVAGEGFPGSSITLCESGPRRCPYPPGIHADDCDCDGAGGPR